MHRKMTKPVLFLCTILIITMAACGGKPTATSQPTATNPVAQEKPTETVAPKATEVPSGLVMSLTDLKKATIQIEAEGTFIDPEFGYMANAAGRGSGFIIDPSGIAVTNNHVVTGAALLKVWVGGDTTKVYNARILGVSECSDLAVIDIEGDGFPYLNWYEGAANVGLEVYAAGYPLGDPEFTLTKGIVSKEKADGETSWASIDSVIEHTATINPGNSGGPLVDANAEVVGINYASVSSTNQYYAIDRGTALPVIEIRSVSTVRQSPQMMARLPEFG
jgi:serine protease Do